MIENSLYRSLKEGFTIWISQRDSWGEWLPCTITCFWLSKWCKTLKCWIEDTSRLRENKWSGLGYSYLARAGRGTAHTHLRTGEISWSCPIYACSKAHTHTNTHIHKHKYKQEHKDTQTRIQSYESRNCLFISTHPHKCLRKNLIMADYIQAG